MLRATMTKERAVILLMIAVAAALLGFAMLTTGRLGGAAPTVTGTIRPATIKGGNMGGQGLVGAVLWWPEAQ